MYLSCKYRRLPPFHPIRHRPQRVCPCILHPRNNRCCTAQLYVHLIALRLGLTSSHISPHTSLPQHQLHYHHPQSTIHYPPPPLTHITIASPHALPLQKACGARASSEGLLSQKLDLCPAWLLVHTSFLNSPPILHCTEPSNVQRTPPGAMCREGMAWYTKVTPSWYQRVQHACCT